jgi:AraC family transcriptional regulator of adaptative response/methylated-DNA-[protein]-cysteine methyltransferase
MHQALDSLAGFREAFGKVFRGPRLADPGVSPLVASWIATPLGPMVAAAGEAGICLLEYTDPQRLETQLATLRRRFGPAAVAAGENAHVDALRGELDAYFAGRLRDFTVPLVYPGTGFEVAVWDALRAIPYGSTRSYLDIAKGLRAAAAVRAVGQANGRNRIAIVIPCHRVVNTGGGLGGYGGGLWRKERLLALERGQGALG